MTELTREQVAALLDGTTPGPWEAWQDDEGTWAILKDGAFVTFAFPAECGAGGDTKSNAGLIAAAPDLARQLLAAMDRLADADMAQAALVERAAEVADANCIYPDGYYGDLPSSAIRALAPDAGVKGLAALRANAHSRETEWAAIVDELRADRDRLAAELAEARKREDQLWERIRRLESRDGIILITTKEEAKP